MIYGKLEDEDGIWVRMNTMLEELKPCPFCNSKPILLSNNLGRPFLVMCDQCLVIQNDFYNKEEYAIEAWNKRA